MRCGSPHRCMVEPNFDGGAEEAPEANAGVRVRVRVKSGLLITRSMHLSSRKPAGSYQLDL